LSSFSPHATPEEVYDETTRIISILGKNGGYVVSPSHQVQGDTTVENVIAIFNAVKDYKYD
jgi:uroporphyrinogen decarboxylase